MSPASPELPGFLAVSSSSGSSCPVDPRTIAARLGIERQAFSVGEGIQLLTWGLDAPSPSVSHPLLLSRGARRHETALSPEDVGALLANERTGLAEVLPPFGALGRADDATIVAVADALGFRHLYYHQNAGWAALSTSARAIAGCTGEGLDPQAVAVQSLLGWQLGQRTMFTGVTKLAPGSIVTLARGAAHVAEVSTGQPPRMRELDDAVREAAQLLRTYMASYLDDNPDPVLQLTGGQDSRILLSAIPVDQRRGLRVMTLGVPGTADVDIAARMAQRYGMSHQVQSFEGIEHLTAEQAYESCLHAAARLECTADPLAFASLAHAEASFDQGPRISGLGGEVARGFYYVGPARLGGVTRRRTAQLAAWRMFANESVDVGAFEPEFAARARELAIDEIFAYLAATGKDWFSATDDFYVFHRMQRWAGVTDTAVCFDRAVTNPMLDDRFLDIARNLAPDDKRDSRFLARLQMELDPELAGIPLDGRPAPIAFAEHSLRNSARKATTNLARFSRKAKQRIRRSHRPPAGAEILSAKISEHLRRSPALMDPVRAVGVFRESWIDDILAGRRQPGPSDVALLLNLRVAVRDAPLSTEN